MSHRTTVHASIWAPVACETGFRIQEAELELTFNVLPGEPESYNSPGCDPEAELESARIRLPGNALAIDLAIERLEDFLGDDYEDLVEKAIEQAGQEAKESREYAAEEHWEREREERMARPNVLHALMDQFAV